MWKDKIRYSLKTLSFILNLAALAVLTIPHGMNQRLAITLVTIIVVADTIAELVEWALMKPSQKEETHEQAVA